MYECKFVSTSGTTFNFGYSYGTIFDLSPLGELDVEFGTSQGYQQTGTTVESQSLQGVSREITGVFLDYSNTDLAQRMQKVFKPRAQGKLYFNDSYYCECYVQKTPAISLSSRNIRRFSLMLYCPYPYWMGASSAVYQIGGYEAAFEFPVCYDEHTYGIKNSSGHTNVYNEGQVEIPFSVTFTSDAESTGYGIQNVYTGDFLKLDDALESGEIMTVYFEDGRLKIEKTVDNSTEDAFYTLTEDSTLFELDVGDNLITPIADSGLDNLSVHISINPAYVGVIAT